MNATIDIHATFTERPQCDLRVMCGPRYNVFVSVADRRETAGRFFQQALWKAMSKPSRREEDSERWDGMG